MSLDNLFQILEKSFAGVTWNVCRFTGLVTGLDDSNRRCSILTFLANEKAGAHRYDLSNWEQAGTYLGLSDKDIESMVLAEENGVGQNLRLRGRIMRTLGLKESRKPYGSHKNKSYAG